MKSSLYKLGALASFALAAGVLRSYCQTDCQFGIVGYCNTSLVAGSNLVSNPFQAYSNKLSDLFNPHQYPEQQYNVPEGTRISLWNPTTSSFVTNSTLTNGSWSIDFPLFPGVGALIVLPVPFTNTFQGIALNHDGNCYIGDEPVDPPPPLFTGQNGVYLVSDKTPLGDVGTDIFLNIVGRLPYVGEQVIKLAGTNTYLGDGLWDSTPTFSSGEAVFLNIISEPPPKISVVYTNNQAVVSWPSSVLGWTLQTNNDLTTGNWADYTGSIINNTATNPALSGNLFFRLAYPTGR